MKQTALKRKGWLSRGKWKPMKATELRRGTPLRKVNAQRQKKRLKAYRARLAKSDWQALRLQAFRRDKGLCQCPVCIDGRKRGAVAAFEAIPIWYDVKGKIHGFDTHHTSYARWGKELLSDLLTMTPAHHRALERKMGYRQRWLSGRDQ